MNSNKIRLAITHGDINGISYEIIFKTLIDSELNEYFTPIIYGSSKAAAFYKKQLNNDSLANISLNLINSPQEAQPKKINIINVTSDQIKVEPGISSTLAGEAAAKALELAVNDMKDGWIDCVVTCPINKSNIFSRDYDFPGHTEFFADRFNSSRYMMLMVSDMMRIGFATGHVALQDVSQHITEELLLSKLEIMHQSLQRDFMIRNPKIGVLALNPHASDHGLLGKEEEMILIPAIEASKNKNMLVFGPYSADGFFATGMFKKFDAVLAMYHDQGMIPFKSLGLSGGVNFTAGLSIVRTSPAHGTAYDIAGMDKASPKSLREAMFLAREVFLNRRLDDELNQNPLPISKVDNYNSRL